MNNQLLKIAFDAKRAFLNKTGLGNYSRTTIRALARHVLQNEYFLYTPTVGEETRPLFLFSLNNIQVKTPAIAIFKSFWRSKGIIKDLKRDKIQLYHGLSQELPIGIKKSGIKTVVTIHDLIYLKYPKYFDWIDRKIYEWKARNACENADLVIAVSEQTKADLISFFNINPEKIKVVYQGWNSDFTLKEVDALKQSVQKRYQLPQKFILNVGTIETRKNLLLVVKALKNIPADVSLVVIGRETEYAEKVKKLVVKEALQKRVIFLKNISFYDLPSIYHLAQVFVYPSRYEGFGIPVLEALTSGTPVVAATGSCLEEAGGPDSFYVDPDDAVGLAEKVNLILQNDQLRLKMKAQGFEYAKRFREENIAKNLMDVYLQVLNNA
ncbi:glycosyltransferase family 1 protein [uncultured Mucilaginibacter sp.]|uniref:glycosyltransferase family 4 protein n=1 Tax=uncultured Mucilaginibacter sp. TaxID=797541 RepID=UPI002604DAE2|nr:glycosyltransferase family 1 protein [uncultured Mucilaginibacter sp.]